MKYFLLSFCAVLLFPALFATRPEVSGDRLPLPGTVKSDWGNPVMPLDAKGKPIPLLNRAGKYRLLLKLRSSDRSGNEGDSMLGGYTYFLPFCRYRVNVGSREIPMAVSRRMVKGAGREKDGTAVYTGWLYSGEVELEADAVLTLSCTRPGGFLSQLILLDAEGWEAEKLRSGDLFTEAPGKGFGNAWESMTWRPVRFYSLEEFERLLAAFDLFEQGPFATACGEKIDFSPLRNDGKILAGKISDYLRRRTGMKSEFRAEGAALAAELRTWLARCDREFRETFTPLFRQSEKKIGEARKRANPQSPNGREALFNLDLAAKYLKATKEKLDSLDPESEIRTGADEILCLSYCNNLLEFLSKGERFASQEQADRFPGKRLEKKSGAPGRQLVTEEKLNLNGVWQFGPGSSGKPPQEWAAAPVPNNGPAYFYNPKKRSDQEWADTHGVYWESGGIPSGWFKTEFTVPADWSGNALTLRFGELMLYGEVFVNGIYCGSHAGGFYPFEIDVTRNAVPGEVNEVMVFVHNHTKTDRGNMRSKRDENQVYSNLYPRSKLEIPFLRISGDVELIGKPALRIENVYVQTSLVRKEITVTGTLFNASPLSFEGVLEHMVTRDGKAVLHLETMQAKLKPGERQTFRASATWENPEYWGIGGQYGRPENMYLLKSTLASEKARSESYTPFGFREMRTEGFGFTLNGHPVRLQGDSYMESGRYGYMSNIYVQGFDNQLRRKAYINLVRPHRGWYSADLIGVGNWTGMMMEGEAPWWNFYAPPDITGRIDYADPVWLGHCEEYYRNMLRSYRNHPAMTFWAIDNETMNADNAVAARKFQEWSREEAPHLISSSHSHASAWDPHFPTAILHDYDLGLRRMEEWMRIAKELPPRPLVMGEYWNANLFQQMRSLSSTPGEARAAERVMARWLERSIKSYFDIGAAGVMPFTFNSLGATFCSGSINTMGPWGDRLTEHLKKHPGNTPRFYVDVDWPSLTGSGGIRPDKITFLQGNNYIQVNAFDPVRPVATLTSVVEGYRKAFDPMPENAVIRPPELLLELHDGGRPLAHVNVFAAPLDRPDHPAGVRSDAAGKAWLHLRLAGTYRISFAVDGREYRYELPITGSVMNKPGWEYLPKLKFDLSGKNFEFFPGRNDLEFELPVKGNFRQAETTEKSATRDYSGLPPIGEEGFIRAWQVYGPFPNYGGRDFKTNRFFNQDLLLRFGGEMKAYPQPGAGEKVAFKKIGHAYWEDCEVDIQWRSYTSKADKVNLAEALVIPGVPGLDGALESVFGYAATYVESDRERQVVLAVGSDDGYKIWLNGKYIGGEQVYRGCKADSNRHEVVLREGWNLLLVKIEQDISGFEFMLRILDREGKPLILPVRTVQPEPVRELVRGRDLTGWFVLGPFPNGGTRPRNTAFDTDFLSGEASARPDGHLRKAEFPEDGEAYWEKGVLEVSWRKYLSPGAFVDLGRVFRRPEYPGLDTASVEYAAGYAFTEFSLDAPARLTLVLESFNGARVYLNGKEVISDRVYTFNRDPNSAVLPESKRKLLRIPVELQGGVNRLLLKLDGDFGPLDFRLRFE